MGGIASEKAATELGKECPHKTGLRKSQTLICNLLTQGLVKLTDPKLTNKIIKLPQFVFSTHLYTHQLWRPV